MKYISRIKRLSITLKPSSPIYEGGQRVGEKPGKYAKFENGMFETKDKEIIAKLESLPTFGFDFLRDEKPAKIKIENTGGNDVNLLEAMTKPQLEEMAKEKGLDVPDNAGKKDLIKLLTT